MIKAHSRNAVTATHLANFVQEHYSNQDPPVHVELVAFDPVPGPGHTGEDVDVLLNPQMRESTVVYSVDSGYSVGFNPQKVRGAKRVIISAKKHDVGYKDGVILGEKLYKGSRIGSLPAGSIYISISAKEGEAEKVKQCCTLDEVTFLLYQTKSLPQKWRRETIEKISEEFFGHEIVKKGGLPLLSEKYE